MLDPDLAITFFGNAVKAARHKARLSQDELADLANISRRPLYLMESGKGAVRLDTLIKVLDALGLEMIIQPKRPQP